MATSADLQSQRDDLALKVQQTQAHIAWLQGQYNLNHYGGQSPDEMATIMQDATSTLSNYQSQLAAATQAADQSQGIQPLPTTISQSLNGIPGQVSSAMPNPQPYQYSKGTVDEGDIKSQYQSILGRDPTSAEVAQFKQYANTGSINLSAQDIGHIIQLTPEYQQSNLQKQGQQYQGIMQNAYQQNMPQAPNAVNYSNIPGSSYGEQVQNLQNQGQQYSNMLGQSDERLLGLAGNEITRQLAMQGRTNTGSASQQAIASQAANLATQRQSQLANFYGQGYQNINQNIQGQNTNIYGQQAGIQNTLLGIAGQNQQAIGQSVGNFYNQGFQNINQNVQNQGLLAQGYGLNQLGATQDFSRNQYTYGQNQANQFNMANYNNLFNRQNMFAQYGLGQQQNNLDYQRSQNQYQQQQYDYNNYINKQNNFNQNQAYLNAGVQGFSAIVGGAAKAYGAS